MSVLLTPAEMAVLTDGVWENLVPGLLIKSVEYVSKNVLAGDLFFDIEADRANVKEAEQRGATAIVTHSDYSERISIPVLRVKKAYSALRTIALATSKRSRAKRVLVTGGHERNAFKNHLRAAIEDQCRPYARTSSARQVESTYSSLASLTPEHTLLIVEQPIWKKENTLRRAKYVSPDICVITSVDRKNTERTGKTETTVENVAQIAKALKAGGIFIIPYDEPRYTLLKEVVQSYGPIDILTYGTAGRCHARMLYSHKADFGWDVVARIGSEFVAYHIPFSDSYEPMLSLGILLSVQYLGGSVHDAASRFSHILRRPGIVLPDATSPLVRMERLHDALKGLSPLVRADMKRFHAAAENAGKENWVSFFPFLHMWGASSSREILLEEIAGAVCIYLFRAFGRDTPPTLELFMPPMPLKTIALKGALQRLECYAHPAKQKIVWVESRERDAIERSMPECVLQFKKRTKDEFVYAPSRYDALDGKVFRHLRHSLSLVKSAGNVRVVEYEQKHTAECLALLEKWKREQGVKYAALDDHWYTKRCLETANLYDKKTLMGIVVLLDGHVAAFGFAGMIRKEVASFYIGKYDPAVKGLNDFLRVAVMQRLKNYERVNDSYAVSEGVAFSKRMMRPIEMLVNYTAYTDNNVHKDANQPVILTPAEMAEVTDGVWENLSEDLRIVRVEHTFHYLQPGDLFVVFASKCHKIPAAVEKEVAALIVDRECHVDLTVPVLRVENPYSALRKIALRTSKKSHARRVLVTGSYGKTGFKNHLYDVVKDQFDTYAKLTSANHVETTYCNLASLRSAHELLIIEQPVSTKTKTARRAGYVQPDICVITSIGHEHIERFPSVDMIIENKTQIAKALKKGGKFFIPADDPYFEKLRKALSGYDHFDLLTFGRGMECNARLLFSRYSDFGWDVVSKIEDIVVAYRVPFPERHAPTASLAVLLSVYHLGGNVLAAAQRFYTCTNFHSSGKLYTVTYGEKHFYLYDQSYRGGIEGYQAFFRSLENMKPPNGGRTILVTSEFVDYADGEMALIDHERFRELIAKAGIDLLFTVEKFTEHINVLPDRSIWQNHSIDYRNIEEEVIASIEDGDILCVKGIYESALPEFVQSIFSRDDMTVTEIVPRPVPEDLLERVSSYLDSLEEHEVHARDIQ